MSDSGSPPDFLCTSAWIRNFAWFIAETARPISIWFIASATGVGFLMKLDTGALGVMATLAATLYGAKVVEKSIQSRADADVAKSQAKSPQGAAP